MQDAFQANAFQYDAFQADPPVDKQVAASGDDGWWHGDYPDDFSTNSTSISCGHTGYQNQTWARFTDLAIAQAATINVAYVSYKAYGSTIMGTLNTIIRANDADNASAPTDGDDANSKALTAAGVAWAPGTWTPATWYDSPEIKTVVQEVIDRVGWASGSAFMILHLNNGGTWAEIKWYAWDSAAGDAPKLHIEYTVGGVTAKGPPVGAQVI
jgi:hypothetical protein